VLHFRIAVVTRGGLKEGATSNDPIDDEAARIFKALCDPRATGRCSDTRGLEPCLFPGNSRVELIIDWNKNDEPSIQ
jgi:hypothetical protein